MTGGEIAQIIVASATLVTALGAVVIGLLNTRRIREVHMLTNSKMTQLIEEVRIGATATGVQQGREMETKREPL